MELMLPVCGFHLTGMVSRNANRRMDDPRGDNCKIVSRVSSERDLDRFEQLGQGRDLNFCRTFVERKQLHREYAVGGRAGRRAESAALAFGIYPHRTNQLVHLIPRPKLQPHHVCARRDI